MQCEASVTWVPPVQSGHNVQVTAVSTTSQCLEGGNLAVILTILMATLTMILCLRVDALLHGRCLFLPLSLFLFHSGFTHLDKRLSR